MDTGSRKRKRTPVLVCALAVMALLCGCASETPVEAGVTAPARSSAPVPSPSIPAAVATPAVSPGAETPPPASSAAAPAAVRWPATAAGLFAPGSAPDDYAVPAYISSDRRMILYATNDGTLRKALWNGAGYGTVPLVEQVDTNRIDAIIVDEEGRRVFCPGTQRMSDGKSRPTVVMVHLTDGKRCNLDDLVSFKERGCTFSADFQFSDGRLLVRLADDTGTALNQWALVDIAGRSYTLLDLAEFSETYLPGWRQRVALNVAFAGADRLVAICAVGNYAAPASTGSEETVKNSPYECFAIPMNLSGKPVGEAVLILGGTEPSCCHLQDGVRIRASNGGKYLLYSSATFGGICLFDMTRVQETSIPGVTGSLEFAHWGEDGAIYYALAEKPVTVVYRITVDEALAAHPAQ